MKLALILKSSVKIIVILLPNKTNNNEEFITVCDELKKHNIFIKNIQLDLVIMSKLKM